MYAIVETGGKQYKVEVGQTIEVERLPVAVGETVELDRVLMVREDAELRVGGPLLRGAKVLATVVGQGKARKIIVFKYKPKNRYRRKKGHRQLYTRLLINDITLEPEKKPKKAKAKPERKAAPKKRAKAKAKAEKEAKKPAKPKAKKTMKPKAEKKAKKPAKPKAEK
ncbi:MAG: 50S ribosomal protein L21, partial [Anaerolineae bacterium]